VRPESLLLGDRAVGHGRGDDGVIDLVTGGVAANRARHCHDKIFGQRASIWAVARVA